MHPAPRRSLYNCCAVLACISGAAPRAAAHDFFLIPLPVRLDEPGEFLVQMHVSEAFPGDSVEWRAEQVVQQAVVGPRGQAHAILAWPTCGPSGLSVNATWPGMYMVSLNTIPSRITLEGAEFNEYIRHEGHDALLAARTESGAADRPARERYSRYVKTIVSVGRGASLYKRHHLDKPVGHRIEIIPKSPLLGLRPGSSFEVLVLYEGKPLVGALVSATHQGFDPKDVEHGEGHYAFSGRTDDEGKIKVPITGAGLQLIRVTQMIALPDDVDLDYDSFWASLTFHVPGP